MHLVTSLFLLLVSAHLLGKLCVRLKQPALAGHMVAGILLGPSLLAWIGPAANLSAVADIAVLFVVLTAGLEMRLQHVLGAFKGRGAFAMLLGFFLPAAAGAMVAASFALPATAVLVIALCIAVTALPVALQILRSFGLLHSRIAHVAISGALLSDILVLMLLGVLIDLSLGDAVRSASTAALLATGKLIGLVTAIVVAQWACSHAMKRRSANPQSFSANTANLSFAVLFVLGLGALSELLGFHFAIGAFFAAMMITPELIGAASFERLENTCEVLTASLFAPLFLAYQGLQFQAQALTHPALLAALLIAAISAKLLGGYLAGRLQRLTAHEAWGVGIVMNAHGVMALIVASIAFHAGLIDATVFSTLLIVGMITTLLTPPLLKRWQSAAPAAPAANESMRAP
jgi:Kef-type K+ transport system membrane component KefB